MQFFKITSVRAPPRARDSRDSRFALRVRLCGRFRNNRGSDQQRHYDCTAVVNTRWRPFSFFCEQGIFIHYYTGLLSLSTRLLAVLDIYLKERFMILNCSRTCLGR